MDDNDRAAIEDLFDRLTAASRNGQVRDPEAEALIARRMAATPGAAYSMAQTIVVQEHALAQAEERIAELETRLAERGRSGGFLAGLFGEEGGPTRPGRAAMGPNGHGGPVGLGARAPAGGSGFLGGAAQTAMGVAGGVLIANAIAGFWSDGAAAEEFGGFGQEAGLDDFDDGGFDL